MFYQEQTNNTHKAKSWCYSLGVLAVLAGGAATATPAASADILGEVAVLAGETTTPSAEAAQTPVEAVVPIEPFRGWESDVELGWNGGPYETIHFVNEDGTTAAPDIVVEAIYENRELDQDSDPNTSGSFYYPEFSVPQIPGYTASLEVVKGNDPLNGDTEVRVVYTKNAETPSESSDPSISETPAGAVEVPAAPKTSILGELDNLSQIATEPIVTDAAPAAAQPTSGTKLTVLPDTGENMAASAILTGTVSVAAAGFLGLAARLKQRKN